MNRLFRISLFIVLLFCSFREPVWRHEKIGNSKGLSNSAVTSVYQDSKGYIWFGTWDGLNQYDGRIIKVFKPNVFQTGNISNNIIRQMLEDKNHNLWIITENGINKYNRNSESFIPYLTDTNPSEYQENRFSATLDQDSTIWCSKYYYGVCRFDSVQNQYSSPLRISNRPDLLTHILGFGFSQNNHLWCINADGILYDIANNSIHNNIKLKDSNSLNFKQNWFIKTKDNLIIFIAYKHGGILKIDTKRNKLFAIRKGDKSFHITSLSINLTMDYFWGGTDNGEIFRLEKNSTDITLINKELPELSGKPIKIWTIKETEPDLLWIGTDGDGVYKYITKNNYFSSIGEGNLNKGMLNHKIVRAILEDKDENLWVGTRGNGINIIPCINGKTKVIDNKKGLYSNAVLCLGKDKYGNIWIGEDAPGIDMYDASTGKILHFPDDFGNSNSLSLGSVYAICQDSFGDLWVGTSGYGIYRFTIRKKVSGRYDIKKYQQYTKENTNVLKSNIIYSIIEGSPNVLWVGTRGAGLYRLNTLTDEFQAFLSEPDNQNSLNNNDVLSLWKAPDQKLWIGTSGGLNCMNMETYPYKFTHFTENEGLPNNTVHAILGQNNSNIWISTNKGLAQLNTQTGKFKIYNQSDGLRNNEFTDGASCIGKKSGLFYFGGIDGLDAFHPGKVKNSLYFPRIAVTNFTLLNKAASDSLQFHRNIDLIDTLNLKYNQNFFRFDFTSLNYHSSEKCRYIYKLENFNNNYITAAQNHEATFTNVPPGEYIFKIKWTNEDGSWNSSPKKIYISIDPPLWKTNVAYLIYALLFVLTCLLTVYLIRKQLILKQKRTEEWMAVQKTKEINQYKFQFFTNIAHEFRTPLTLIMAPASQLLDLKDKDRRITPYIKSIYNNAARLLHLIQELIDFRRIETGYFSLKVKEGNLVDFVRSIIEAFDQYAGQKGITLSFRAVQDDINGWFDRNILEKVLLNIISNALKYTPAGGKIAVSINCEENNNVSITVKDNGIGIPKEFQAKIFHRFFQYQGTTINKRGMETDSAGVGLSLTQSLVELHKGSIRVESEEGKGSSFKINLPIEQQAYSETERKETLLFEEPKIKHHAEIELIGTEKIHFEPSGNGSMVPQKTVLVVDDNEQIRNLLFDILHLEYKVLTAASAREALNQIQAEEIHIIVSDIIMPGIDGLEFCRMVKENIYSCHIPLILLTAKGEIEQRIEGIESGADSYIPKPFNPRHLKARIRQLIENKIRMQQAFQSYPFQFFSRKNGFNKRDNQIIEKLQKFIEENLDNEDLDADLLAEHLNMSKTHLYRKIRALTDFAPHALVKHYRLKKAEELLKDSSLTVSEIIYATGFKNRTYFYRSFKELFHKSPTDFRKAFLESNPGTHKHQNAQLPTQNTQPQTPNLP
jgi:signal transduction histidine kinase/ligand-binding sensor domain-containing protein/DNA-binding response OmpR family regulator